MVVVCMDGPFLDFSRVDDHTCFCFFSFYSDLTKFSYHRCYPIRFFFSYKGDIADGCRPRSQWSYSSKGRDSIRYFFHRDINTGERTSASDRKGMVRSRNFGTHFFYDADKTCIALNRLISDTFYSDAATRDCRRCEEIRRCGSIGLYFIPGILIPSWRDYIPPIVNSFSLCSECLHYRNCHINVWSRNQIPFYIELQLIWKTWGGQKKS